MSRPQRSTGASGAAVRRPRTPIDDHYSDRPPGPLFAGAPRNQAGADKDPSRPHQWMMQAPAEVGREIDDDDLDQRFRFEELASPYGSALDWPEWTNDRIGFKPTDPNLALPPGLKVVEGGAFPLMVEVSNPKPERARKATGKGDKP